jgi:hypothetical protein
MNRARLDFKLFTISRGYLLVKTNVAVFFFCLDPAAKDSAAKDLTATVPNIHNCASPKSNHRHNLTPDIGVSRAPLSIFKVTQSHLVTMKNLRLAWRIL